MSKIGQIRSSVRDFVWERDLAAMPRWKAWVFRWIRLFYAILRDVTEGRFTMRATSLVYTTLIALVPLLAFTFSILQAFGVHNQMQPVLARFFEPLGERGVEISSSIITFVEDARVGVIGTVGLLVLIFTGFSLLRKIEQSFNQAWHASQRRSYKQRCADYLSVAFFGPILLVATIALTASVTSISFINQFSDVPVLGGVIGGAGRFVPYFLIVGAFTFFYFFLPNATVRIRSALIGGLIAGTAWELMGWAFATYVVTAIRYSALYSSLATLVIFMIWIYASWLILLLGSSIAFYHQHPEHMRRRGGDAVYSGRLQQKLGLLILAMIGRNFFDGRPVWTMAGLAAHLRVPSDAVEPVLEILRGKGFIAETAESPPGYVPARSFENTGVAEVVEALRESGERDLDTLALLPEESTVENLMAEADLQLTRAFHGMTLKSLAMAKPTANLADARLAIRDHQDPGGAS